MTKETTTSEKTTDANLALMKNIGKKEKKEELKDSIEVIKGNEKKDESPNVTHDDLYMKWKEECRLVKGIFRCHEPRGGSVTFSFKKYKWDPVKTYTFVDGEEYEIPLSVARHLNQNCNYPVHSHIMDKNGVPTVDRQGKKVSRMNFESLDFI